MRDLFRFLHRIRSTLIFLTLLVISLVLLYNGNAHHRAQAISSSNSVVGTIYTWRKEITDYTSLKEVNRKLAEENAMWRNRHISMYSTVESRFVRIHDTIRLQEYTVIPTKVVNSTWHKPKNYLTLDKGSKAGLHGDMGVIGTEGIVGVVSDVNDGFASVISVLSPDIKTSVQLRRTGHFGLLYWDTNDPRTASVIDIAKHARVAVGDTVETRGGDGIFPAGIPVGLVEEVVDAPGSNYHGITIRLTEDMTRSGFVYVVEDLRRAERDTLQKANERP
ncbi:MAG: rod shape-determining protein MreC [Flavobacteriales bacterium]|jgi:rod shape-determining protein MreC|nr:rod shape-determining protein MreC [Flavobacteriales bacterium]MBK6884831.1 rod shape-determining protein MreC [Flavobacteriales bacterium]MBK7102156.1 rod shape-determining protein MreC [Flavobacteriales bacterium]MBK7483422.1 rod shape-determining protein MreC [Flavobacteriales bacterium]MBP9177560.1 rod shape-determining protein MreC [Flavobacteriales bacterium]